MKRLATDKQQQTHPFRWAKTAQAVPFTEQNGSKHKAHTNNVDNTRHSHKTAVSSIWRLGPHKQELIWPVCKQTDKVNLLVTEIAISVLANR